MYNPHKAEKEILEFWKARRVYDKLKNKNKRGKKFYFLQGPPYTSGRLHIGHAWNNSLKDIALRYKRMQGLNVWDKAGYDMHGLPTENSVQKKLKLKDKKAIEKYGMAKFVKACESFSTKNAKLMDEDLLRLGVWLDYEQAYYPIKNSFIESEWWFIKQAHKAGRLYKGKKIMHWCASCETSLAKHELEYENVKEKSIFLKFHIDSPKQNEYLIIWTTTPWTIPFNLAVMVNPELDYVKAEVGSEVWILAKALAGPVIKGVFGKKFKILKTVKGKKLLGIKYEHPLYEELRNQFREIAKKAKNTHTVILSEEYVDTTAGSGLVHSAPGCGPEDYEVGQEYDLPAFNHLNEKGEFFDMGKYNGMIARKNDEKFIIELKKKGALIATTEVEHEYPFCWRCHKPVVFRATKQWFLRVEDLVQEMLRANKTINWIPNYGKTSLDSWLNSLKDNSITRQRFWGAPVPIWECECGRVEVIGSKSELKTKATSPKKITKNLDLHKPWIDSVRLKCSCGREMYRVRDVLDVWLDSGILAWTSLDFPEKIDTFKKLFPADFILEATEQIKLWFSMLLMCSTVALHRLPYKNVYMHGMILDWQGTKMSKSLGNIISPYEVLDKVGADVLRYYMCGTRAGENINFNWQDAKIKQKNLIILWNLHNYTKSLARELKTNPEKLKPTSLNKEERYILSKLNSIIEDVTKLFENYRIDSTIHKIESLFLELSRVYIQLVREKIALGSETEKKAVLYTIYNTLKECTKMFSTICPFITEKIWQGLKTEFKLKEESIHLCKWPSSSRALLNKKLEADFEKVKPVIQEILAQREQGKIGIRWPLPKARIKAEQEILYAIKKLSGIIKTQTNIKALELSPLPKKVRKKFEVKISTKLTQELEAEGYAREISRRIQSTRKKAGLVKEDKIILTISTEKKLEKLLESQKKNIAERVNATSITFTSVELNKQAHNSSGKIRKERVDFGFDTKK